MTSIAKVELNGQTPKDINVILSDGSHLEGVTSFGVRKIGCREDPVIVILEVLVLGDQSDG